MTAPRRRRTKQQARDEILAAALRRFVAGGPSAVRVQLVADDVGMTDAAVHHHFGNRDGLLRELLRDAVVTLSRQVSAVVEIWHTDQLDVDALIQALIQVYRDGQMSRVAAWLALDGWKPRGRGMFRPIAEALQRASLRGRGAVLDDERAAFAALMINEVAWTEAFAGELFHRAAGFSGDLDSPRRYRQWLARVLHREITGAGARPPRRIARAAAQPRDKAG